MNKNLPELVRPKKWEEVKGQDKTVSVLKQQILVKKGLSNAYIFSGKSGIGKTTLARLFFMALNCQNPKDGNPCLECDHCKNLRYKLIEINASDKRGIDDIRDVTKEMHYTGFDGGYKGILLDEVHMLTKPAFNCLLKPLEESPEHCVWFLCTTEISKIPKTIRTRCQSYKLNAIRWTDIFNRLKTVSGSQKIEISEDSLWKIARNSDTNLRQALHLLEKYSSIGDIDKILSVELNLNFLEALRDNDLAKIHKIFDKWDDKFTDIDSFLNALKYDLATCLKLKMGLSLGQISPYRKQKYQEIIGNISESTLINAFTHIVNLQQRIGGVWDYSSLFLMTLLNLRMK